MTTFRKLPMQAPKAKTKSQSMLWIVALRRRAASGGRIYLFMRWYVAVGWFLFFYTLDN